MLLGALWRAIQEGQASMAMPLLLDTCQALQSQVSTEHLRGILTAT